MKAWQRVFVYELARLWKNRRELLLSLLGLIMLLFVYELVIVKLGDTNGFSEYAVYTDEVAGLTEDTAVGEILVHPVLLQGPVKSRIAELLADKIEFGVAVSFEDNIVWYKASDTLSNSLRMFYVETIKRQSVLKNHPEAEIGFSNLKTVDLGDKRKYAQTMVGMSLPLMLLTLLTVKVTSKVSDITSLEQKNGTLARVLLTPVSVRELLLAKTVFACFYGTISSVIYITLMVFKDMIIGVLGYSNNTTFLGVGLTGSAVVAMALAVVLFSVLCASCVILFFSLGKGHQSTQLCTMLFVMGVYVLVWLSFFRIGHITAVHYLIPFYDVALIMQDAIREDVQALPAIITIVVNAGLCVVIALYALRRCEKENLAFD